MCHKKNICPLFKADSYDECVNCPYLQNIKKSIMKARIALAVVVLVFIVTTYMVW